MMALPQGRLLFRRDRSAKKMMLTAACDSLGILLIHRVPSGQTVNQLYYREFIIHHLRPAIRKKRPSLLEAGPLLLHDNASLHTGSLVRQVLQYDGWQMLLHTRRIHRTSVHATLIYFQN
jgi:hypothetical protein